MPFSNVEDNPFNSLPLFGGDACVGDKSSSEKMELVQNLEWKP
jgi:hypothetical protein